MVVVVVGVFVVFLVLEKLDQKACYYHLHH